MADGLVDGAAAAGGGGRSNQAAAAEDEDEAGLMALDMQVCAVLCCARAGARSVR